jgi:hypothetical protein
MLDGLLDNVFLRKAAAALESDHNRLLGIRNTMRLAKSFNRLKNRRECRLRRQLYDEHLPALLEENGPAEHQAPKMTDGWVIDSSRRFKHLDRLLADAQQIIAERGGVHRGGGERSFFQQILTDEHIARFSSILDFATSTDVVAPVVDYMRSIPVLSVSKPLGVRLAESDVRFAEPSDGVYRESQLFHRDYHDAPMVYVIVTLRDVTRESGPFSFLPAAASRQATAALRYGRRGRSYRVADEEIYSTTSREELVELACPAGTVLFVDSSLCFHYGSRDAVVPRYLMMYAYVSVCRSDFGDLLRKESPVPVLDDSARTNRAAYPIGAGDSRLRRLLLDRRLAVLPNGRAEAPAIGPRSSNPGKDLIRS